MSIQVPVYVVGFGDVYREFFNAIAATIGSKGYGSLLKLMLLLGGCWTLVIASFKKNHLLNIRWIITYVFLTSVILLPNVTVVINDRALNKFDTIDHIPLGLGVLATITTGVGQGFTELVESVFHMPNDLSYTQSGMLMGSKIISASSQFQVVGGDFQKNLQGFVQQCVFYDVLLRKYSLQDLMNATNLWSFVAEKASPARAFLYNNKVTTCQQGAQSLSKDWQTAIQNSENAYAHLLFVDNTNAKAQLLSYLGTSYQYLANLSDDASSLIQQNMMIQAIQDGMGEWASGINAETALQDFAYAKAQEQKRTGYQILFQLAVYWLPLTKTVMELVLLGSFLIIVLFLFFPFGVSVAKNYVMTFVWLQLWPPLFAFQNFILTYYGSHLLSNSTLLFSGGNGLTLTTYSALNQMNADLGTLAGFFAALTPLIAVGIFKGMMSVFSQAANYMGGAIQSFAFAAAGEAVTGNISLGNTQFNNHSAYNTSSNHFDTSGTVSSGIMTYQLASGGTASVAPDGEMILNSHSAISQLPVSPHMAQSMQQTFSKMAESGQATAFREAHSAQASYSSGLRDLYELGNTLSHTDASSTMSSLSDSGSFSNSVREAHQLAHRFAIENNLSDSNAYQILGSRYASIHGGGSIDTKREIFGKIESWMTGLSMNAGVSGGGKKEWSHTNSDSHNELMNKADSFMQENNFGQAIENSVRAAKENNFRTGSEASDRLAKSMSNSFEQGERYANDAMNSYEQSQSYRQQASLVQNQSVSIDTQANQEFVDWLQKQPSIQHHGGGMGAQEIMTMMQENPHVAEEYARDFVRQKERQYIQSFSSNYSAKNIKDTYSENDSRVGSPQSIQQFNQKNEDFITQESSKVNTGKVVDSVTSPADSLIQTSKNQTSNQITSKENSLMNTVNQAIEKRTKKYEE